MKLQIYEDNSSRFHCGRFAAFVLVIAGAALMPAPTRTSMAGSPVSG